MLHRRANKINRFHERCLRIIYNSKTSTFKKQVENGRSVSIHTRKLQFLDLEMFKVVKVL